jgi:tetratricopeptide (TPR) repeat protein
MRSKFSSFFWIVLTLVLPLTIVNPPLLAQPSPIPGMSDRTTDPKPDRKTEADRLRALGDQQVKAAKPQDALTSYQGAIELYRQIGDPLELEVSLRVGQIYLDLKDDIGSIESATRTLKLARMLDRKPIQLAALRILLKARMNQMSDPGKNEENSNEILMLIPESLDLAIQQNDPAAIREVKRWKGHAYLERGKAAYKKRDYLRTEMDLKEARSILHEVQDSIGEKSALNTLILMYFNLHDWKKIPPLLNASVNAAKKSGNEIEQILDLNITASFYLDLGDPKNAVKVAEEAIPEDKAGAAGAIGILGGELLFNRGIAQLGDLYKAGFYSMDSTSKRLLEEAYSSSNRNRGMNHIKANTFQILARAYAQLGEFDRALTAIDNRRYLLRLNLPKSGLANKVIDPKQEIDILLETAKIYYDQGSFKNSQSKREEALGLAETVLKDKPESIAELRSTILYQLSFDYPGLFRSRQ